MANIDLFWFIKTGLFVASISEFSIMN